MMPKHDFLGYLTERDDLFNRATLDRLLWHAEHDAALLVLSSRRSAELAHLQQTPCTIISHSGHDDSEGAVARILCRRPEQHVSGRPVPRHRRSVLDRDMIARPGPLQQHMTGSRSDIGATGLYGLAVLRL